MNMQPIGTAVSTAQHLPPPGLSRWLTQRLARNWTIGKLANRASSPVVSFTFDDFPKSAVINGARILRANGVRGTFFASGLFEGHHESGIDYFDRDDLVALAADGHEIGCHTFGHLALPYTKARDLDDDLARNAEFVRSTLDNYEMSSFAYPFGFVSIPKKAYIGRRFPIARGIWPGVNETAIDFRQLKAISLDPSLKFDAVTKALDRAQASNGWVIFFTHDVSVVPSHHGVTPPELERILDEVLARRIDVLPMKNAAAKVRFAC